jgi:hypothetical protein
MTQNYATEGGGVQGALVNSWLPETLILAVTQGLVARLESE